MQACLLLVFVAEDFAVIGVLGGIFDPVHFGHLRSALEVQKILGLQQVHLVPCRVPSHRVEPVASTAQRVAMLELAIGDQSNLFLDQRELYREGPSYSIDTLVSLRSELLDMPLCLMIGMDAFQALPSWHRWDELADYAHIVVMTRPGWELPDKGVMRKYAVEKKIAVPDRLYKKPGGHVYFCEVTRLEISATMIREQLGKGRSPRYLLPESVLEYIQREGLYQC